MANIDADVVSQKVGTIVSNYSRAMMTRNITLHSLQAQRVVYRNFDKLRQTLFSISVILPQTHSEEEVKTIDAYIDSAFDQVMKELEKSQDQMKKVLDDMGVAEVIEFSNPMLLSIKLDTPRISRFLGLIMLLDDLIRTVETMWLCGQFTQDQRTQSTSQWQRRLLKLSARIIGMEQRIRNSAKTKGLDVNSETNSPDAFDIEKESAFAEAEANKEPLLEEKKAPAKQKVALETA